jgi:hypothetical protein
MTWGELKAENLNTPDDTPIFIDAPDEEGNMPELDKSEVDEDGDLVLIPEYEE